MPDATFSNDWLPQLQLFPPIALAALDGESLRLLNRVDRKYVLPAAKLPALLSRLCGHYQVLEIEGKRTFQYATVYYDTPGLLLYQAHHNRAGNRVKIRSRQYVDSGQCFFEVKRKYAGYRTDKLRYETGQLHQPLDEKAYAAIRQQYKRQLLDNLQVSLRNTFRRITLVSEALGERCTIDVDIAFESPDGLAAAAPGLAVVELKQRRLNPLSPMVMALRAENIFPCSFSKYIYGLLSTRPALKHNAFKPLLHRLERIQQDCSITSTHAFPTRPA